MGSPEVFPKGLDFADCLNVTLVLRDFQVLTGRFRGLLGDRDWNDEDCDGGKWKKDDKKKDDKCCKPPKVDIEVEVEEETKFVLLELTRPAAAVNLSEFLCVDNLVSGIDLTVSGTTFPVGACVTVNVENILYAGTTPEFCDIPIYIGSGPEGSGLTVSMKKK